MSKLGEELERVNSLSHGETCVIFSFEGGGGEVYRLWDMLFLFMIPQYGGEGQYQGAFRRLDATKLVAMVEAIT